MWDGVFGEPVRFLLSRGGGTIVQRGESASFGPREWGLTTMDREGSWSYEADPDGVESVCDGNGHGNGGGPGRNLWRAARVRSPGGGEEAGGRRQDQLCGQVRQGCLGQRQGSPV